MTLIAVLTVVVCLTPHLSGAQGWEVDARTIGLSGIGGDQNIFAASIAESQGERSFSIPLGLFQTLRDLDTLNPRSASFNPLRAIEYGTNPLHLQFGRARGGSDNEFVHGIRNASLSRDLNDYRGFVPRSFAASGLVAPRWGRSFTLGDASSALHHAVYVGAGPHLALRTDVAADPMMVALLGAEESRYVEHGQFHTAAQSSAQLAVALTGGYRGRLSIGSGSATSTFFSVNANYLHGLRLEDLDLGLDLETDATGRLRADSRAPLGFDRRFSSSGRGLSMDVGLGAVIGPWEIGGSANNLAHRMTWSRVTYRRYSMPSLFSGDARFVGTAEHALGDVRWHVPPDYRANLSFTGRAFTLRTEVARGWDKVAVRAGIEHSRRRVQFRVATAHVDSTLR